MPTFGAFARWTAVLVAVACTWGQLATATHIQTTPHVVCAEHGEVMDAPVEAAHEAEPLSTTPTIHRGADPIHSQGHEHCVFALHARQLAAQTSPSSDPAVLVAPDGRAAPPLATHAEPPAVTLYRLAPKTSPPV